MGSGILVLRHSSVSPGVQGKAVEHRGEAEGKVFIYACAVGAFGEEVVLGRVGWWFFAAALPAELDHRQGQGVPDGELAEAAHDL